jgi:hypothetical protein
MPPKKGIKIADFGAKAEVKTLYWDSDKANSTEIQPKQPKEAVVEAITVLPLRSTSGLFSAESWSMAWSI